MPMAPSSCPGLAISALFCFSTVPSICSSVYLSLLASVCVFNCVLTLLW